MDRWDIMLLLAAGYVSVVALVRLMANRRNELIEKIRAEITKQREAKEAAAEADQENQDAA